MAYDSEQTRKRLLDAGFDEFVAHGLAGARVDRIATAAGANKQAIYAYFGSKEGLFDAVLEQRLGVLVSAVPMTPDDLVGYGLALFDYLTANPAYVRLNAWNRLERREARPDELASYRHKVEGVAAALPLADRPWSALNVLFVVLGLAHSWDQIPEGIRALDATAADPAVRTARHRAAIEVAIRASIAVLTAD